MRREGRSGVAREGSFLRRDQKKRPRLGALVNPVVPLSGSESVLIKAKEGRFECEIATFGSVEGRVDHV